LIRKKTQERVRKLRKKLPSPKKCSKCGKEIVLESPDAKPFTIKGEPVCKDCWCKEMGEEMEKHPIMLPEKLRKSEEEISVVVQSPTWGPKERQNWLKFRAWIEANGGKWEEGIGCHKITFKPLKKRLSERPT